MVSLITDRDYNEDGDLKGTVQMSKDETKKSLDNLITEMLNRLKKTIGRSNNTVPDSLKLWGVGELAGMFGHLRKTIITPYNINQANDMKRSLVERNVVCNLSVSLGEEVDPDREQLRQFIAYPYKTA